MVVAEVEVVKDIMSVHQEVQVHQEMHPELQALGI
jgi:hypothetical protein